ncbi:MAG: LysR substrate-binding domain-containing protein, partial [Gammaproteobacteria bacterium]|nr:LysR substrate-binding domain-containing protein [Gammaproteobacteria bacterium]
IQAALDGQGVALGSTTFVQDHLDSGRLIKPFDITLSNEFAYYIVCPPDHLNNPAVKAFKNWIIELTHEKTD